jgi:hypothetical protein
MLESLHLAPVLGSLIIRAAASAFTIPDNQA